MQTRKRAHCARTVFPFILKKKKKIDRLDMDVRTLLYFGGSQHRSVAKKLEVPRAAVLSPHARSHTWLGAVQKGGPFTHTNLIPTHSWSWAVCDVTMLMGSILGCS